MWTFALQPMLVVWYSLLCDKAISVTSASLSDSYFTLWCFVTHISPAWGTYNRMYPQSKLMSNSPVEIWNQLFIKTSTQVVEDLLMLSKQADVVGDWEGLLWKACDGLHQLILVNVQSEVCAIFHITCYYFWTLGENEKWIRKTVSKTFLNFGNFILPLKKKNIFMYNRQVLSCANNSYWSHTKTMMHQKWHFSWQNVPQHILNCHYIVLCFY